MNARVSSSNLNKCTRHTSLRDYKYNTYKFEICQIQETFIINLFTHKNVYISSVSLSF